MTSGIYKIECFETGAFYIGSAVDVRLRWSVHRYYLRRGAHHSWKLQRDWTKLGEDAFGFVQILCCEPNDLVRYEQMLIDELRAVAYGYNVNPVAGSCLGRKHSNEAIKKISAASLGRKNQYARGAVMSQETKDKISAAKRGMTASVETREKLCRSRAGKKPSLGMRHTEEAKLKMSLERRGKPSYPRKKSVLSIA